MDKIIGESGDFNSNAIDQSQTIEFKVTKGRKKNLVRGIIILLKLILMELKKLFVTIVRKSILLT